MRRKEFELADFFIALEGAKAHLKNDQSLDTLFSKRT